MPPLSPSSSHGPGPRKPSTIAGRLLASLALGVLLSFAAAACAQTDPAQPASGTDSAAASEPQPRQSSASSRKPDGKWHHFGESDSSATPPAPAPAPGVWHHFGSSAAASASSATPHNEKPAPRPSANPPKTAPRRSPPARQYDARRIARLEREMFDLVNRDRRSAGARPLRWNARLAAAARAHSRDMIRRDYFGHVGPGGKSVGERLASAGIDWQSVGENIAIAPTVAEAETEFMDEPRHQENHRWNILNSGYTEVGVGIVRDAAGELYITQDFMKPPSSR